ncbi:MAG TPA: putative baseplate assembly protein [Candidatus Acidoferrum sp.]|nr:putative baseplate assembly protein [Candidatus Acidoferrum sp.]
MNVEPFLICREEPRRERVRAKKGCYGLDYLEVSSDQLTLHVVFLGKAPRDVKRGNFRVIGGQRVKEIQVTAVQLFASPDSDKDDSADVTVDQIGDFSTYRLQIVAADPQGRPTNDPFPGIDPRYDSLEFRFKAGCPSELDCKPLQVCRKPLAPAPEINYLAKDYASFRQLIFDRLATIMPDWQERHVPDIGVALVEVLAYTGDRLSYYQDAVASEAYLDTARERISVRRHARLVDYRLSEGCNARAWITVNTQSDLGPILPDDVYFITGFPNAPQDRWLLEDPELESVPAASYEIFEPLVADRKTSLNFTRARSRILIYSWGNRECCLPQGATSATLTDCNLPAPPPEASPGQPAPNPNGARNGSETGATVRNKEILGPPSSGTSQSATESDTERILNLNVGDYLLFEEGMGPRTGVPEDADPTHRHVVRITKVDLETDTLGDQPVFLARVEWAQEDALPFALCISSVTDPSHGCKYLENVSVACGNVILVDHGKTTGPESAGCAPEGCLVETCGCECNPAEETFVPVAFETQIKNGPLTFAVPFLKKSPASNLSMQVPRNALAQIRINGTLETPYGTVASEWYARPDLLESGGDDYDFAVEMDNVGIAHLRFGDGDCGRRPDPKTCFTATYRVGNGPSGNVGADTIRYLVFRRNPIITNARITNPLPAKGGVAPETIAEAKLLAPHVFRDRLERAITPVDYATLAKRNKNLQSAACELRWTGSWYQARVTTDPKGTEELSWKLDRNVSRYLYRFRRMGHDLAVEPARYVPLNIEMIVCVAPDYLRGHVEAALLDVFSDRVLPDGTKGFFNPDNLIFGQSIYLSQLVAVAQQVTGVESVVITKLERLYEGPNGELANGVLPLRPTEIGRLDNDPSFPENGRIVFDMRGGR